MTINKIFKKNYTYIIITEELTVLKFTFYFKIIHLLPLFFY